jgi:hypothetical protein
MALQRYASQAMMWELIGSSNRPGLLGLSRDELIRLVNRLLDTARQMNSNLAMVLGLTQPWGEYLARDADAYFPFSFSDTLLRNRVNIHGLNMEIVMGVAPHGSYDRDLLETSRLLDLYSLLGLPLHVTLGCPSSLAPDPLADPELRPRPRGDPEWSPGVQADWAARFVALAVCKPNVQAVTWVHLADNRPHKAPHSGLIDAAGRPKPALARIKVVREKYLR